MIRKEAFFNLVLNGLMLILLYLLFAIIYTMNVYGTVRHSLSIDICTSEETLIDEGHNQRFLEGRLGPIF